MAELVTAAAAVVALALLDSRAAGYEARTGDVVLFRWHKGGFLQDMVTPMSHVGVVVVPPGGRPLILETHMAGDTAHMGVTGGGVHTYDLERRVKTYMGTVFLLSIDRALVPAGTAERILRKVPEYTQIPYLDSYELYYAGHCIPDKLCNGCLKPREHKGMFCSQFAGQVLKDAGMLPPATQTRCLTPGSFLGMRPPFTTTHRIK